MMEVIGAGMALAYAAFLLLYHAPQRLSREELPRYQRLSEEMRRDEIYPFE